MRLRWIGFILVALAVFILLVVLYENSERKNIPLSFSATTLLNSTWANYKEAYLNPGDYRTIDPSNNSITTSEGESYTMLRAVWLGDKTTFDEEDTWIKDNLQHTSDHLFSWEFGKLANGSYGVISHTTASDADTDIALALVMAYSRWQNPQYLDDARDIMRDIWADEVVTIHGTPYLTADNLEKDGTGTTVVVNPSYFSPYAYRIFAEVDPKDSWDQLIDSSYAVIAESMSSDLDASSTAELPPDWILMNRTTGAITAPSASSMSNSGTTASSSSSTYTTNFGYDAIRVPFRLALDYEWYKDPRDKELLDDMSFLSRTYTSAGRLDATYTHAGAIAPSYDYESASMYGATIGYFMISDATSTLPASVYNDKLFYLYDPNTNAWKEQLSYYDDNWAWFGIALYNGLLPNLSASIPSSVLASQ